MPPMLFVMVLVFSPLILIPNLVNDLEVLFIESKSIGVVYKSKVRFAMFIPMMLTVTTWSSYEQDIIHSKKVLMREGNRKQPYLTLTIVWTSQVSFLWCKPHCWPCHTASKWFGPDTPDSHWCCTLSKSAIILLAMVKTFFEVNEDKTEALLML